MWRVSTVLEEAGLKQPGGPTAALLQRGYARGTKLHDVLEAYAFGEAIPYPPEHEEYVVGIKRWFVEFEPTVLFAERRVVNRQRLRLTGRIDLAVVVRGKPYIVDLKRSAAAGWHAIQTAGYCELADNDADLRDLAKRSGALCWSRANLYLPGDGRYKWKVRDDPRDAFLFRSALALVQWRFDHGVLKRTDPERPDDDRQLPSGSADAAAYGAGSDG